MAWVSRGYMQDEYGPKYVPRTPHNYKAKAKNAQVGRREGGGDGNKGWGTEKRNRKAVAANNACCPRP
jgi:hypothetical protein